MEGLSWQNKVGSDRKKAWRERKFRKPYFDAFFVFSGKDDE